MKRVFVLILALMLCSVALAEVDVKTMTDDELISLKNSIDAELKARRGANTVRVPIGVWTVGEDIPFGHWEITVTEDAVFEFASVVYCSHLDVTGKKPNIGEPGGFYFGEQIKVPGSDSIVQLEKLDLDLQTEGYIIIEHGDVFFTPFEGKPDLGF